MGGEDGLDVRHDCFLWACVVCCFEPCKEAVEVVEQRDVVVAGL